MKKLILLAALASLVFPAGAFAHARVSPAVGLAKELELYTLAVPTEKENAATTQIEFSPPLGFQHRLVRTVARVEASGLTDRFRRGCRDHQGDLERRSRANG